MTIDYDIRVTAFLCVLVPRKTLTFNNKQTTVRLTDRQIYLFDQIEKNTMIDI